MGALSQATDKVKREAGANPVRSRHCGIGFGLRIVSVRIRRMDWRVPLESYQSDDLPKARQTNSFADKDTAHSGIYIAKDNIPFPCLLNPSP